MTKFSFATQKQIEAFAEMERLSPVPAACLLHADALDDNNGKAALFERFRDTAECKEFPVQAGNSI